MARAREGKGGQQSYTTGTQGQLLSLSMALNCILAAVVAILALQQRQQQLPGHAVAVLPTPAPAQAKATSNAEFAQKHVGNADNGEVKHTAALVRQILDDVQRMRARSPLAAIESLHAGLSQIEGEKQHSTNLLLLDELGDILSQAKRYRAALSAHRAALTMRQHLVDAGQMRPEHLSAARAAVATDLKLLFRFDDALEQVRIAQRDGKGSKHTSLSARAIALLQRLESSIHECSGDFVSALQLLEESLRTSPVTRDSAEEIQSAFEVQRLHLDLLRRVLQTSGDAMPTAVRQSMERFAMRQAADLVKRGPWLLKQQLPQRFVPGLRARAWHKLGDWDGRDTRLRQMVQLLESDATRETLLQDFTALEAGIDGDAAHQHHLQAPSRSFAFLQRERECIHSVNAHGDGEWRRFELTGNWQHLGTDDCASDAVPNACAVLAQLRKLGNEGGHTVIRAGFSELGPGAWLKPHHGMTNAQLKMHLGLIVPRGECANFRVGNETRPWREGKVAFFDDSFEHEAWNRCKSKRVVFQVVFAHPELVSRES